MSYRRKKDWANENNYGDDYIITGKWGRGEKGVGKTITTVQENQLQNWGCFFKDSERANIPHEGAISCLKPYNLKPDFTSLDV